MFDGMPEQYHQFITSSRPPTTPPPSQLPPSFSLLHGGGGASGGASVSFPPFEPYPNNHNNNNNNNNNNSLHLHPQLLLHHPLHHHRDDDHEKEGRDESHDLDLWTNEEVFELLRIRSSMENWFPDFTWSHVSRKLAELGFKKSAEKCKDKFEEESRHLNNNVAYTKNYRIFSELEEIYHGDQNPQVEVIGEEDDDDNDNDDNNDGEDHKDDQNKVANDLPNDQNIVEKENEEHEEKKRKRSSMKKKKFEMLKGFCEEMVNKMMSQQEELNNKLILDLIKRDEQKVAREEAWKKQETERINNEITIRAQEHTLTKERQTKIIEFLNKFTSTNSPTNPNNNNNNNNHGPASSSNHNESTTSTHKTNSDETGKRWPRDEVLALINLRCNHYRDEKEVSGKGPLWERISKGMSELGYRRNAKRCKEKWENINKYFRKTKDVNKKRSADSRTCPYFHQLTALYSQGTLGLPEKSPENRPSSPENRLDEDDHDDEGEKNVGF